MSRKSDDDWLEITQRYGVNCAGDTLRKASSTIFGGFFVTEYLKYKGYLKSPKVNLSKARELLGEQYIIKQQIHNDRLKINKVKRELVPCLAVADEVIEEIRKNNFTLNLPDYIYFPVEEEGDYTMLCNISDWHIGYLIDDCNGNSYNWEIANKRVDKYIKECKKYIDLYDIKTIYVINTGDVIENTYMRRTQEQSCEFLQSMQITKATEIIYRLLVSLAEKSKVYYSSISGNHDRMSGDKKKNYEGDNANVIITEFLKHFIKISKSNKISIIPNDYNSSEVKLKINGLKCKFIHGDKNPKVDKTTLSKVISSDNEFYDLLFSGHHHNFSILSENHGRYIVNTGCLSGYNDYSKSFYCSTQASQTMCILTDKKVELIKDVIL